MPDTTVLPTGGMSGGNSGPNWLLIGGLGVGGVLLLMMLMRGQSAGQPTTAAGASINAALGSIQEQNLNLMGQLGQSTGQLSGQISDVGAGVQQVGQQVQGVGQQVQTTSDTAAVTAATNQNTLLGWLTNILNGVGAVGTQVGQTNDKLSAVGSQVDQTNNRLGNVYDVVTANDAQLHAELSNLNTQAVAGQYIGYANATALTAGPSDPRVVQWLQAAQRVLAGG